MKQPMPRSHLAAARATSSHGLRLALRSIRAMAWSNARSPAGTAIHQSGTDFWFLFSAFCFSKILIIRAVLYLRGWVK